MASNAGAGMQGVLRKTSFSWGVGQQYHMIRTKETKKNFAAFHRLKYLGVLEYLCGNTHLNFTCSNATMKNQTF